jgi:hypothetical protein
VTVWYGNYDDRITRIIHENGTPEKQKADLRTFHTESTERLINEMLETPQHRGHGEAVGGG